MRFPQETREAIYGANGKAVEILWPDGAPEPQIGHNYSLQASHRAGEAYIMVLGRKWIGGDPTVSTGEEECWKATVKIHDDPAHLVRTKSRKPVEAEPMGGPQFRPEGEPERASSDEETAFARAAHRKRRETVEKGISEADEALRALQESGEAESLAGDLRFLRSRLARVKAKAAAQEAADREAA